MNDPLPFSLNQIPLEKNRPKIHPTNDTWLGKFITCYYVCNAHAPLQKHPAVWRDVSLKND